MKKSFIKITIAVILTIIITPQTSLAVWWNPSTWFSVKEQINQNTDRENIPTVEPTQPVIIEKEVIREVPVEKIILRPVEKIVEKIITKTEKVDNPLLLKKIEDLTEEVNKLKSSLGLVSGEKGEMENRLNQEKNKIISCLKEINILDYQLTNIRNQKMCTSTGPIPVAVQEIIDNVSSGDLGDRSGGGPSVFCSRSGNRQPLTSSDQACRLMGF